MSRRVSEILHHQLLQRSHLRFPLNVSQSLCQLCFVCSQFCPHYLKVPIGSQYPQFQTATSVDTRVALVDGLSAPLEIPQKNKSLVFTRMSLRVESCIHTACRTHHGNSLPYPKVWRQNQVAANSVEGSAKGPGKARHWRHKRREEKSAHISD